jgi:hypothetical protein
VRYRGGQISFESRNNFFTDWREYNAVSIDDVTEKIGGTHAISMRRVLNRKEDGSYFLSGIQFGERHIQFIPVNTINGLLISKLRTGDYIGIYSEKQGLDVSHVGIFIKRKNDTFLRHASSLTEYRKVIDQDFRDYLAHKPGIIVFRSRQ